MLKPMIHHHRAWPLVVLFSVILLVGCAGPRCVSPAGLSPVTPAAVTSGRERLGARVRWGGRLSAVRHLRDATELDLVAYPLDDCGRPRLDASPVGRFTLLRPGFVETADRAEGSMLSATGLIVGIRDGRVGEVDLPFPILQTDAFRWWPEVSNAAPVSVRPWVTIGIGGGSGGYGGGIGVHF